MSAWFGQRYLDLLGSIYIYNEHRGYTAIDRVLDAVRARSPDDAELIGAIERHRADERKHYVAAIERLAASPERRAAMGAAAREASAAYSWDAASESVARVHRSLLR